MAEPSLGSKIGRDCRVQIGLRNDPSQPVLFIDGAVVPTDAGVVGRAHERRSADGGLGPRWRLPARAFQAAHGGLINRVR